MVVPRDGIFSITHSNSLRIANVKGVSFVGFTSWGEGVTPASGYGLVISESQDLAWAWSKATAFNISSHFASSDAIEYVECVAPEAELNDGDRSAVRNGNGYTTNRISYIGSYLAPRYKNAGSDAHCDTLQFSGNATTFTNTTFTDTALFASTNAALIMTGDGTGNGGTQGVVLDHTLLAGGPQIVNAYPMLPGGNNFTSGAPTAFNSLPVGAVAQNQTLIIGKIVPKFASVSADSRTTFTVSPVPHSGTWTIDASLGDSPAWFTANAPKPSDATLRTIWDW